MASLSVSSLKLLLLKLLLLLQFRLFLFLNASQIQEYHFCFFSFLTITEFLFLSNLSRLEDLNLDLLLLCLSDLSGLLILLHHFSKLPPPIFSCYITSAVSASAGPVTNQSSEHNLLSFGKHKDCISARRGRDPS